MTSPAALTADLCATRMNRGIRVKISFLGARPEASNMVFTAVKCVLPRSLVAPYGRGGDWPAYLIVAFHVASWIRRGV